MPLLFQINLISKCLKATAFYNAMNIIHTFAVFMRVKKNQKNQHQNTQFVKSVGS